MESSNRFKPASSDSPQASWTLERAKRVQLAMLPKAPSLPGLDIHTHYQPCEHIGGDFYDFVAVSPYHLGFVVGDVAGHGVDAALIMAAAKKSIQIHGKGRQSPRETLLIVSEDLAGDIPQGSFVSVLYGILDVRRGHMTFASAGHTRPIVYSPALGTESTIPPLKGLVIGPSLLDKQRETLNEQTCELAPEDIVLMYTDGLTETMNQAREQFGVARLLRQLKGPARGARTLTDDVLGELERFRGAVELGDDLTLLTLRFLKRESGTTKVSTRTGRASWPTNLRPETSPTIGRDRERDLVVQMLQADATLVTVLGIGGVGKSRLVRAAGRALLDSFPGGVWHVDLGEARSAREIADRVAQALSVPPCGGLAPEQAVADSLEIRQPTLIILDGFEHLTAHARETVGMWLEAAPNARFLVASEAALGMKGEREVRLEPLSAPVKGGWREGDPLDLMRYDAVHLFVQRGMEVKPGFRLDDSNHTEVGMLCHELEGLPLALELAAARLKLQSPVQILAQMKSHTRKLALLEPADGSRSLSGALNWSYSLLAPWEAAAFGQLCVFKGGFPLDGAKAVLKLSDFTGAPDVAGVVQSLLDKSLLERRESPFGPRYGMLRIVREFGRQKRRDSISEAEQDALSLRYAGWCAEYGESWARELRGRHGQEALQRLSLEYVNLCAAQDALFIMKQRELAARLALVLNRLLAVRGSTDERLARLHGANKGLGPEHPLRGKLLRALAEAHLDAGNFEKAKAALDAFAGAARDARSSQGLVDALLLRGRLALEAGATQHALRDFEEAEARAGSARGGDFKMELLLLRCRGLERLCRHEECRVLLEKAQALARELGGGAAAAEVALMRARVLSALGLLADAAESVEQAQFEFLKLGDARRQAEALCLHGALRLRTGAIKRASELLSGSVQMASECGENRILASALCLRLQAEIAQRRLDEAERVRAELAQHEKWITPDDKARLAACAVYMEMRHGRWQKAIDACDGALTQHGDEALPPALALAALKAVCLANLRRPNEALHLIERASQHGRNTHERAGAGARFVLACARAAIFASRRTGADALASAQTARAIAAQHGLEQDRSDCLVMAGFELLNGSPPPQA